MPNNTFAVNHFPWPDPNFLPCRDPPPVPSVYKLDRNVRRPVYTNFKEPHFSRFFSKCISIIPETWEQICPPFEIKTSKESGMNEIGGWPGGIFIAVSSARLLRPGSWLTIEMSEGERFLGAETAICIDQCFIITSITSSHTWSRTRAKAPIIDRS